MGRERLPGHHEEVRHFLFGGVSRVIGRVYA